MRQFQPLGSGIDAVKLCPHPAHDLRADYKIDAHIEDCATHLTVAYRVRYPEMGLHIPQLNDAPQRRDDLWQHTCCEIFVAAEDSPSYTELNFSPSGDWAAYRFDDYRQPAASNPAGGPPSIEVAFTSTSFNLSAAIAHEMLPSGPCWLIGLSCVLEHANGDLTYWALHHPGSRPDFHQRTGFTLPLRLATP